MIVQNNIFKFIEYELLKINNINYSNFKNHSIILKNTNAIDDILLIHGLNSSPINWFTNCLDIYKNNYNIYIYALPGFSCPLDINILNKNNEEIINYYNENLKLFIIQHNIKPHLVGHSFGGFLAINFSLKYPNYIKTLIPINTIGIINNIDKYLYLYSVLIKTKVVNHIAKVLYNIIYIIFLLFLKNINKSKLDKIKYIKTLKKIYFILNITRPDYYGIDIIGKFTTINPITNVYCNKILLIDMLTKKIPPITFIWSKYDKLIPYYIPQLFVNLLAIYNKNIPKIIILPNSYHGFGVGNEKLLYTNIIYAIKIATPIKILVDKNKINKLKEIINKPLNVINSKKSIIKLYKNIYQIMLS